MVMAVYIFGPYMAGIAAMGLELESLSAEEN